MEKSKKRGTSGGHMVLHEPKLYEKPKPSFRLSEDELPAIKDWTPGKKYKIVLEVEMRSHSKGSEYGYDSGEKKRHEGSFVILDAKEGGGKES